MAQPFHGGLVAVQSNRIEDLVARLVHEFDRRRAADATTAADLPFIDHLVVVPTRNLETYLTFEIAARRGVAAGIEFLTIERFLERLLPTDADDNPEVRILDQMALTRLVFALLDDESLLEKSDLAPVRDFVIPTDESRPEIVERRKFQLAYRIARLFEEYGYARRQMLRQWQQGESGLDGLDDVSEAHLEIERWQRALWRELFADGTPGAFDDDIPRMTLPDAVFHFERSNDHQLRWPETVHIFAHSYLPRFFRDLFSTRTFVDDRAIALYVMNPSRQYWSHGVAGDRDEDPVFDLLTDESILSGDEYPLALDVWGRAGRDYQRLIDDVAHDRIDAAPLERTPAHTLLQHFQRLILEMETAADLFVDEPVPDDQKSINFWSCASIQRECEAIASEIQELVTTHDDLRFNDIAVVVQPAERTLYQTHLQAAFEQTGPIPCNVIDVEGAEASPLLEAAELLLTLPLGEFRRPELLALLVHPCLIANYPEADDDTWLRWCDELNIFQGADRDDLDDTYLDEDRFTWGQGLRRLVLGAFMSQSESDGPDTLVLDGDDYLPHETNHGDLETVGLLSMVAGELIDEAQRVRNQRQTLGQWMEYFADIVGRHLEPRDRRQRRTRMQFLGALARLGESDPCPDDDIGYRAAYDFAMSAMAEIEDSRGHYLADGVVVSAFRPMRPIPFEVVFVTGLGEGKFPAPDPPDMLDLRRVESKPHDVNPRYRDQYMFLETVISTRSRLYLSWVGRHAITGDPIEPASVVHQFREMLLQMTPHRGQRADEVRQRLDNHIEILSHPLRRWDDIYFPQLLSDDAEAEVIDARGPDAIPPEPESARDDGDEVPERRWPNHHREARYEARVLAVRQRLEHHLPTGYRPSIDELKLALDDGVFARLADLIRWYRPDESPRSDTDSIALRIRDLRNFLQCPLQGAARVLLGIYTEDDEDLLDAEHEPFEGDFLTRLTLLRQSLNSALADGDLSPHSLESAFDQQARTARLAGRLPAGVFYDAERNKCLETLRCYASALTDDNPFDGRLQRIRFGGARRRETVDELRNPLQLTVDVADRTIDVELHGSVDLLDTQPRSTLVVAAGKNAKHKHLVDAGLQQIILQAADIDTDGHTTTITTTGDIETHRIDLETADAARNYLRNLTADLLDRLHDYFLPVEFAADIASGDIDDYTGAAERKKEPSGKSDRPDVSSIYGPVRRWNDAEPLPRSEAEKIVRSRYAPFLDAFTR